VSKNSGVIEGASLYLVVVLLYVIIIFFMSFVYFINKKLRIIHGISVRH